MISHGASTVKELKIRHCICRGIRPGRYVCFQAYLSRNTSLLNDFWFSTTKKAVIKVSISRRKRHSLLSEEMPNTRGLVPRKYSCGVRNCGMILVNNWFSYCCSFQ